MEKQNCKAHSSGDNDIAENDILEYLKDTVRLSHGISVNDISSDKGAVFEISEDQKPIQELHGETDDPFCDQSLISSLSLGAGNGFFDDDENSSSDDNSEPFERLARDMEDVSGDGGVFKKEVSPGIGSDIPNGALVTFHYNAFLEYNDEPFDSTYLRNRPERKRLDAGDLLPGVNIALKTMRKDETARFLIKPMYAYGEMGCQPRIPPKETLLYEIYLVSYVDAFEADRFEEQELHTQQAATFQEKLEGSRGYHRKGNDLYREGNFLAAKNAYTRAAWIMEDARLKNEEEEKQRGMLLLKLYSNLAQVYLNLKEPAKSCSQCKRGLSITGVCDNELLSKLYFRFGKAKSMLCDFSGALRELRRAQRLRPHNDDVNTAIEELLLKREKYESQEKFFCKKMFQSKDKKKVDTSSSVVVSTHRDSNDNLIDVRPEFKKVIKSQISDFASSPDIWELSFPSNLSQAEIAYIAAVAKAADLMVTVKQRGTETLAKITKK